MPRNAGELSPVEGDTNDGGGAGKGDGPRAAALAICLQSTTSPRNGSDGGLFGLDPSPVSVSFFTVRLGFALFLADGLNNYSYPLTILSC